MEFEVKELNPNSYSTYRPAARSIPFQDSSKNENNISPDTKKKSRSVKIEKCKSQAVRPKPLEKDEKISMEHELDDDLRPVVLTSLKTVSAKSERSSNKNNSYLSTQDDNLNKKKSDKSVKSKNEKLESLEGEKEDDELSDVQTDKNSSLGGNLFSGNLLAGVAIFGVLASIFSIDYNK
jgi:hypothetical protein